MKAGGTPVDLRVLTIWQPFASQIVAGDKTVEARSWSTTHRGPVIIHAGRGCVDPDNCGRPHQAMLGVVDLVDVHRPPCACQVVDGYGGCHWVFDNPRRLARPIPASGKQTLWRLERAHLSRREVDLLASLARRR